MRKLITLSIVALLCNFVSFGQVGAISGPSVICTGAVVSYSDTTAGGVWTTSSTSVITIGSTSGVATPVISGTATISYTVGTYHATYPITVYAEPDPIAGTSTICLGACDTLTDGSTGGTWSVGTGTIVTISSSGIICAVSSGISSVTYTMGSTGCVATTTVTVSPGVSAITGTASVCVGGTSSLSDATSGGTWYSSSTGIVTVSIGGVITGISSGLAIISYTATTSCGSGTELLYVTVNPTPAAISGSTSVCVGDEITLTDATSGGTWTTSSADASVGSGTGIVTGASAGIVTISYSTGSSSCATTMPVTVGAGVSAIYGTTAVCVGSMTSLADASGGGTWTSDATTIATVGSSGVVTGVAAGTATISYTSTSTCGSGTVTVNVAVSPLPTITASVSLGVCNGGVDTLEASGGVTYSWSPSTGLSCATCGIATVTTTSSTTYTVIGYSSYSCTDTVTVTVDGNRIKGQISFIGTTPSDLDMKVWLIQYNSTDSSLIAEDSMLTCVEGGTTPYYQFNDEPTGNYMVKSQLLSSVAGTSGYIPTYSASSPHWDSAVTISHTGATDVMNIDMLYGTVPSGPGFIGGLIVDGAGKATSGDVPDPYVLVYLMNTSFQVLTYTYTGLDGMFSFSGLAYGNYIIYPTAYDYTTTPSSIITLSSTVDSSSNVDFKQHTMLGTITPYTIPTLVSQLNGTNSISVYPNPSTGNISIAWQYQSLGSAAIVVTDMLGRDVYKSSLSINNQSGTAQLSLSSLNDGIYFISIRSGSINYSGKLQIAK